MPLHTGASQEKHDVSTPRRDLALIQVALTRSQVLLAALSGGPGPLWRLSGHFQGMPRAPQDAPGTLLGDSIESRDQFRADSGSAGASPGIDFASLFLDVAMIPRDMTRQEKSYGSLAEFSWRLPGNCQCLQCRVPLHVGFSHVCKPC